MPFSTPIYRVKFNGNYLPGYTQQETLTLLKKIPFGDALNRQGGSIGIGTAALRDITINMRVLSTLDSTATGQQHFENCRTQLRTAYSYLDRIDGQQKLYIGDQSRYLLAEFKQLTDTINAKDGIMGRNYDALFIAQPYFYDDTVLTNTVSGNGTLSISMTASGRSYPTFQLPSTLTAGVLTAPDGRTFSFTRGAVTGTLLVDCARLTVVEISSGTSKIQTVTELNWGFYYPGGTGAFAVGVTGYAGSGTITMSMQNRYER